MRKKIIPFLLLTAIIALAYSLWVFQNQITDAQKQADALQDQLAYYENSTSTLQTRVNSLEAQLRDLQNPTYTVTIENISSTGWGVLGGVTVDDNFFITIRNTGVRDVGGLTFRFKILDNGTVWDNRYYDVGMIAPEQLGVLHVQESAVITARILSSVGVSFGGKTLVVTVMLDKTVLDERTLTLPSGYG
jgi:cell division septum initiation protein DivIVA